MGLNDYEVKESRKKYGSNEIKRKKKNSFFSLLLESLGDPIIKILLIALGIKIIFLVKSFDWFETIGILIAIFLASFISTISEYGSEAAFEKLQKETEKIFVKVLRNKKIVLININEIVKNDVIVLETGDKVPADGHLLSGYLSVNEASINGETKEVKKTPVFSEIKKENKVYRGTVVYGGSAKVLIDFVGDETLYGKISEELQENNPESPLKVRLRGLAKFISKIGYIGAILVSLSYLFTQIVVNNHFNIDLILSTITNFREMFDYILYALTLSVTIIVVAVPEEWFHL